MVPRKIIIGNNINFLYSQSYFSKLWSTRLIFRSFRRILIKKINSVQQSDMKAIGRKYISSMFVPKNSLTTVICHTTKCKEVAEAFSKWVNHAYWSWFAILRHEIMTPILAPSIFLTIARIEHLTGSRVSINSTYLYFCCNFCVAGWDLNCNNSKLWMNLTWIRQPMSVSNKNTKANSYKGLCHITNKYS